MSADYGWRDFSEMKKDAIQIWLKYEQTSKLVKLLLQGLLYKGVF